MTDRSKPHLTRSEQKTHLRNRVFQNLQTLETKLGRRLNVMQERGELLEDRMTIGRTACDRAQENVDPEK